MDVLRFNENWVEIGSFVSALAFAGATPIARRALGRSRPIEIVSFMTDMFRGAGAFPLALLVLAPLFPALGAAAQSAGSTLVALGALSALLTVLADWRRSL